jgi:hypothetical protein
VPARIPLGIGFADLRHRQARHHHGGFTRAQQTILQGQRVHHGSQHTHVVAGDPVETGGRQAGTPEQVATAYHDTDFYPGFMHGRQLACQLEDHLRIDAGALFTHQRLATEFYQDSLVFDCRHRIQVRFV